MRSIVVIVVVVATPMPMSAAIIAMFVEETWSIVVSDVPPGTEVHRSRFVIDNRWRVVIDHRGRRIINWGRSVNHRRANIKTRRTQIYAEAERVMCAGTCRSRYYKKCSQC